MLLPKYTIRQLMIATVLAAFICAILGFAARGNVFAYGLGIAILGLVVPLATYAFVYWTLLAVSKTLPGSRLPIGPAHPVSLSHFADYDSAEVQPASQVDPEIETSAADVDGMSTDENVS